jgi:hypothetical protein
VAAKDVRVMLRNCSRCGSSLKLNRTVGGAFSNAVLAALATESLLTL